MVRVRGAIARLALGTTATWGHDGAGPLRERCATGREGSRSSRRAKRHPGQNRRRARPYPASSELVLSRCVTWGSRPRLVARDGFRAVTASRVPMGPVRAECFEWPLRPCLSDGLGRGPLTPLLRRSNQDALDLVQAGLVVAAVIELSGAGRGVVGEASAAKSNKLEIQPAWLRLGSGRA
jgi:hypothetical protein